MFKCLVNLTQKVAYRVEVMRARAYMARLSRLYDLPAEITDVSARVIIHANRAKEIGERIKIAPEEIKGLANLITDAEFIQHYDGS